MIKADTNKVDTYVLPNIKKSISLLDDSYNISCNLKNVLSHTSIDVSDIPKQIYSLKKDLNLLNISINKKIDNINSIEYKKNNMISKVSLSLNNINNTTLKNKTLKTNSTGAKIVNGFSSILKSTFPISNKIYNIFTSTGAKFFNKIKSYFVKKSDFDISNNNSKILSNEYKLQELNKIKQLAINDSQIDTSGKFTNFTDFQNILLSDISLIELLWDGDETNLNGKTIGELYKESLTTYNEDELEYDKLVFDANAMLEMTQKDNWSKYRSLVLGKLVRYGFSDVKIKQKISGKDGFDAFVLEDVDGNTMVYFPCTNLTEQEDYLYDSYPVLDSLSDKLGSMSNIVGAKKIYNSQQKQAKELLESCVKNAKKGCKVNVSGFSLGGSLAEGAYLDNYVNNSDTLGNIILYNPYHNRLTKQEANILKKDNKLKLYVCEGDSVSTVFNYNEFSDVVKPVYINYQNYMSDTTQNIDNNNSVLNLVVDNFKNQYCDKLISVCDRIQKNTFSSLPVKIVMESACKSLDDIKTKNIDAVNIISQLDKVVENISPVLKKFGYDISDYNLDFVENIQYVEIMFTSTHLTYVVDANKNNSFDENGNIKTSVNVQNGIHTVEYPSFNQTSKELLGSNPYNEVSNIINDIKK